MKDHIIYLDCGEIYEFIIDHHSYTLNLSSCEIIHSYSFASFTFYKYITNSQSDQLPVVWQIIL